MASPKPRILAPFDDKVPGEEDERGFFEVHHWGVWLADPALDKVNAREQFLTTMPTAVETTRPRRMKDDKKPAAPVNIVTFHRPAGADDRRRSAGERGNARGPLAAGTSEKQPVALAGI